MQHEFTLQVISLSYFTMALVPRTGRGQQMAIFLLLLHLQPSNSARGFVDKTEARLAPGFVQFYSEAVKSTDVLLVGGKGHGRIGEQGQTRC